MYSGPIDCTVKLYKRYGIAHGYFRGTWSTIYRDIYAWGIYLLVFEAVRVSYGSRSGYLQVPTSIYALILMEKLVIMHEDRQL